MCKHATAHAPKPRPKVLPFRTEPSRPETPLPSPNPAGAEAIAALEARLGTAIARTGLAVEEVALSLDEHRTASLAERPYATAPAALLVTIALALVALIPDPTARLAVAVATAVAFAAERAVPRARARLAEGGSHAR